MVITKVTESKFEIDFDESEVQKLSDIETIFDLTPKQLIRKSVNSDLRKFKDGMSDVFNRFKSE